VFDAGNQASKSYFLEAASLRAPDTIEPGMPDQSARQTLKVSKDYSSCQYRCSQSNHSHLLVEIFRIFNHLLKHYPGIVVIWACNTELLNLFELVHSEDASCVLSM
jgi:hypothetical protein